MSKIKVLDGSDFRDRWKGLCIKLEDYVLINNENYDNELFKTYCLFDFDLTKVTGVRVGELI
jgi:hypothetical protein